ncbi:MAG: vWA domain-containing protein [Bacteroidia bacterium]
MEFERPYLLLLLAVAGIPALIWFMARTAREKKLQLFADSALFGRLIHGRLPVLGLIRVIAISLVLILLTVAAAGPQIPGGREPVKITGIDLVVAFDVSNSMLADDLKPNRFERSRMALTSLTNRLDGDRFGLVAFAGDAYTQLPLTNDIGAAQMLIESMTPDMISLQGTNIAAAIDQAMLSFGEMDDPKEKHGRAIVIVTDGEDFEQGAVDAAKKAREKGVVICTIGIGSTSGATIPQFDSEGTRTGDKQDENGQTITTKLNEDLLKEIAAAGDGIYAHSDAADLGTDEVYNRLRSLTKSSKTTWRYTTYKPVFYYFLWAALVLLVIEALIPNGIKSKKMFS